MDSSCKQLGDAAVAALGRPSSSGGYLLRVVGGVSCVSDNIMSRDSQHRFETRHLHLHPTRCISRRTSELRIIVGRFRDDREKLLTEGLADIGKMSLPSLLAQLYKRRECNHDCSRCPMMVRASSAKSRKGDVETFKSPV